MTFNVSNEYKLQTLNSRLEQLNVEGWHNEEAKTVATSNSSTGYACLYFRDGTTAGTLKLVVRAGNTEPEITIFDNIPQT